MAVNGKSKRASAEDVAERIKQIKAWLSQPLEESNIIHRAGIEWGVTAETVRKYMKRAMDEMEASSREHEAELILRSELTEIKDRAMRHADFSTAVLSALLLAKMNGVRGLDDIAVVVELRR